MKLVITKARDGGFTNEEGEKIEYHWYKALRGEDGATIEFGSVNEYEVGDKLEIDLEKTEVPGRELKDGKRAPSRFRYKEPTGN